MTRRGLARRIALLSCFAALIAAPAPSRADPLFTHTLRFIVPFPPGGTLDVLARSISAELGQALGQTVMIDNRPGASGVIGAAAVAHAPPDGHTIFIASNTLVTLPALRSDLPFDVFKDFAPVILLGATPTVLTVNPSFPARDVASFIAAAKALKGKGGLSYDSPGVGSPPHIAGELLARAADIPLVHIPYRGTQPAVTDLVGGQIPAMMAPLNAVLPFIQSKQLIGLAVTDATRSRFLPDVPTLREAGVTAMPPVSSWFAILTTGGTPPAVVTRLNQAIRTILADPTVQERLSSQTFETAPGSPADLATLMRNDARINADIVSKANIRAD